MSTININLTNVHKYVINITYNIHKISIEFFRVIINFSGYSKHFSCEYIRIDLKNEMIENVALLIIWHRRRATRISFNNGSLSILAYVRPTPFTRSPCGNATSPWLQHWNPAGGWQNGEAQYSARQKRSRIEERRRLRAPVFERSISIYKVLHVVALR